MEDFRVDVVVGKGPGATAIPLDVEPFTLVGATTRAGLLTGPLRDRFGFVRAPGASTTPPSWSAASHRSAAASSACRSPTRAPPRSPAAPAAPAHRQPPAAPGPRLRRGARPTAWSTRDVARGARCRCTTSTSSGLDRLDQAVLTALVELVRRRAGRAVHPRRGGRGAARHRRGGGGAVPGAGGAAGAHPAGPGGHPGGLAPSRAGRAGPGGVRTRVRRARSVLGRRRCVDAPDVGRLALSAAARAAHWLTVPASRGPLGRIS